MRSQHLHLRALPTGGEEVSDLSDLTPTWDWPDNKCAACDAPENARHQLGCPALVLELIQSELRPVLEKLDELVNRKRKRGKAISEGKLKAGKVVPDGKKDLDAAIEDILRWLEEKAESQDGNSLPNRRDICRAFQSKYDYAWLRDEAITHCIREGLIVRTMHKPDTIGGEPKEFFRAPVSEVEARYRKLEAQRRNIEQESGKDAVPDALLTELREAQAEYEEKNLRSGA
jgi:hypothetical protein